MATLSQHRELSKRIPSDHFTEDFKRPVSPPRQERHKVVILAYDAFPGSTFMWTYSHKRHGLFWYPLGPFVIAMANSAYRADS